MAEKKSTANIKSMYEKIFSGENKVRIIVLVGIVGMLLVLFSSLTENSKKTEQSAKSETTDDYIVSIEKKILDLVTSIDGVGRANVMVTVESGIEYIYAKEEKKNIDTTKNYSGDEEKTVVQKDNIEQRYILVDGGNGKKQALLETQLEPKIKGVVVVCEGADNVLVEQRILGAVTTALSIPSNKVCVTKIHKQKE